MNENQLRKFAGLPQLTESELAHLEEAKKKAMAEDGDGEAAEMEVDADAAPEKSDEQEELPAIVTKIALTVCKKFGIGDPKGGESKDLTAMQDFLNKVYAAGLKDGAAAK